MILVAGSRGKAMGGRGAEYTAWGRRREGNGNSRQRGDAAASDRRRVMQRNTWEKKGPGVVARRAPRLRQTRWCSAGKKSAASREEHDGVPFPETAAGQHAGAMREAGVSR